ncbi:MAG: hypothetical protein IPM64_04935 [Phycisphaerales bacterium]|nr:hypothetical protein [Phycisphaerales bacterium]
MTHGLRLITAAAAALLVGCTINLPDPNGNGNANGNSNSGGNTTIRVRVVNTTNATLDPDVYVTGEAVTDPAQLFSADRKFTRYGVGTLGILGPGNSDEFTLECSATRVVGTGGGRFGNDLQNPDGVGNQRIMAQDVFFVCGDVIVLTYRRNGNEFTTTVSVTR